MKVRRSHLPATQAALGALGAMIASSRRSLGWTQADLAARLGVAEATLSRIEQGAPGTAIGLVFDAAVLCGVPLFSVDPSELPRIAELERARLALLPARVRHALPEVDDDF
ncbi:MAG TPA: helix-turn-helix transcriptional regulator [Nannocystaceae bacterium]|nr:helix-turn-helix transcriptional regulator [Nannocystaceae bacterium]